MRKNISKLIALILTGCLFLTGCANEYFGLPGLFMEVVETLGDPEFYEGIEEYDTDIWVWPDYEEEEISDTFDWDDYDHDEEIDSDPGTVTILVYMNGSTLETEGGVASKDIQEMLNAGYSENVNVVIQTMGTKYWSSKHGIASNRSQTYVIGEDGLELVRDDLGQLDCTIADTLYEFIQWGSRAYPAERNILLFWDHGGGPAYGFGWDEFQDDYDNLSIDEMVKALKNCDTHFDFIGMDCCIMSCLEITYALREYCDYMILSEDFESSLGWYYTGWMEALYDDPSISTYDLAKILIDDMVGKNEKDRFNGDRSILALVDESHMDKLWDIWTEFAYDCEDQLLSTNFSQEMESSGKGRDLVFGSRTHKSHAHRSSILEGLIESTIEYLIDDSEYEDTINDIINGINNYDDVYISDYCITDLMGLAAVVDSDYSEKLIRAVDKAILYVSATSDCLNLTGLSVTLPYHDRGLYHELATVLERCSFDEDYITWLKQFISAEISNSSIDWDQLGDNLWNEWGEYESSDIWGEW